MALTPDWVKNAVFYQIFPDRFAKSAAVTKPSNLESWESPPTLTGYKGGDFIGITDHLDYLVDLGITAIYFTPVFASTANYRYHTHDFYQIDPILGGNKAFKTFLDAAHDRGLRVVLDGVFNHASRGFYQFSHTLENGDKSPYRDWFYFNHDWLKTGKPLAAYAEPLPEVMRRPENEKGLERFGFRAWWDLPALPKLNVHNREVQEFILQVAEYWIDFGIDGWRLDVPHEIDDDDFWRRFRKRVKACNPEAYICGEIWANAQRWLKGDMFDGVMNYLFTKSSIGFFMRNSLNDPEFKKCGYNDITAIDGHEYAKRLTDLLQLYPQDINLAQMNLLGAHDSPRILTCGRGDVEAVKLAYLMMFTFPGAPCVYYGDEIGMPGGHDPLNRAGFNWDKRTWNTDLRDFVKHCISLRQEHQALCTGDFKFLKVSHDEISFERSLPGSSVVVTINNTTRKWQVLSS